MSVHVVSTKRVAEAEGIAAHKVNLGGDAINAAFGPVVVLSSYGADITGATDCRAAFEDALADLVAAGGGTLLGDGPDATYMIEGSDWIEIAGSNITLDGRGATIYSLSATRFFANGDPGVAGGEPQLRKISVINWDVGGTAYRDTNKMRGPRFDWVDDPFMENVDVYGPTGTAFNWFMCNRPVTKRCRAFDGDPTKYVGGFLAHMTYDGKWEDCHVLDGCRAYFNLQQKGGASNTYKRCSIRNQTIPSGSGYVSRMRYGFWNRGDAPAKDSNTAYASNAEDLTYPFADKGWDVADDRRNSINTVYESCYVENTLNVAYVCQEAVGGGITNCKAKTVRSGLGMYRSDATDQRSAEATLAAASLAGSTTLTFSDAEEAGQFFRNHPAKPIEIGSTVVIQLDTDEGDPDEYHVTTLASEPNGTTDTTVDIADAIPTGKQASAGRLVFVPRTTVLAANASAGATSVQLVDVSLFTPGGTISIIQDTRELHSTTVDPSWNGSSTTVPIVDALLGLASKGRDVSLAVPGTEQNFKVENFEVEETSSYGIRILGQNTSHLPGVMLSKVHVSETGLDGIYAEYADALALRDVIVHNPGADADIDSPPGSDTDVTTSRGVFIGSYSDSPVLDNVYAYDDRDTPLMYEGIRIGDSTVNPTMRGSRSSIGTNTVSPCIHSWVPGNYFGNEPGDGFVQTTDNTANSSAWRCYVPSGGVASVEVIVTAEQTNASPSTSNNYAHFHIRAVYKSDPTTGVMTAEVGLAHVTPQFRSDTSWSCNFTTQANYIRPTVQGNTGQNINWSVHVVEARRLK